MYDEQLDDNSNNDDKSSLIKRIRKCDRYYCAILIATNIITSFIVLMIVTTTTIRTTTSNSTFIFPSSVVVTKNVASTNDNTDAMIDSFSLKSKSIYDVKKKCLNYEYTTGSWIPVHKSDISSSRKQTKNMKEEIITPTPSPTLMYDWEMMKSNDTATSTNTEDSIQCELGEWNVHLFCNILQNRSILYVGDSINQQLYDATGRAGGDQYNGTVHQIQKFGTKKYNVHKSRLLCPSPSISKLSFIRNDHLTFDNIITDHLIEDNIHIPWTHLINDHDIIVLNTGAHATISIKQYCYNMILLKEYLETKLFSTPKTFIFRTTPRGHINCASHEYPINLYDDTKNTINITTNIHYERYFPSSLPEYKKYHYDWFPYYNDIMKEIFSTNTNHNQTHHNYIVIDLAPILELRPDNHKVPPNDCLHYKDLSIFNIWLTLLQNALQGRFSIL